MSILLHNTVSLDQEVAFSQCSLYGRDAIHIYIYFFFLSDFLFQRSDGGNGTRNGISTGFRKGNICFMEHFKM
jgi:hypothetical protein